MALIAARTVGSRSPADQRPRHTATEITFADCPRAAMTAAMSPGLVVVVGRRLPMPEPARSRRGLAQLLGREPIPGR